MKPMIFTDEPNDGAQDEPEVTTICTEAMTASEDQDGGEHDAEEGGASDIAAAAKLCSAISGGYAELLDRLERAERLGPDNRGPLLHEALSLAANLKVAAGKLPRILLPIVIK